MSNETDVGSFEGSVSADGPGTGGPTDPFGGGDVTGVGISSDKSAEASGSVGGKADFPAPGALDLSPGTSTPVIDSQHTDQPVQMSFITSADAAALGRALTLSAAAIAAALSGGATAGPLIGTAALSLGSLGNTLEHATIDASSIMDKPGAFATVSEPVGVESSGFAGGGAAPWTPEQSQAWFAQWAPDSGNGGNG